VQELVDDDLDNLRRDRAVSALLPLFFVSGATSLVYQSLWARELHLVFGTSTFAISTVLAAFMTGLASGGFGMGRRADRIEGALGVYGALEIGIGLYALVFPWVLAALEPAYLAFARALGPTPLVFGLAQFALVTVALLPPTTAMGATLPLLARFATRRLGAAGDRVGTLYASNTAGAVFGTLMAGFVLLPMAGLRATTLLAAILNLALGAVALALSGWATSRPSTESADDAEDLEGLPDHGDFRLVCVVGALAGGASLIYEVAWTRVIGLVLGASVYAFSVMLVAFLVGIAFGGALGGRYADRTLRVGGRRDLLRLLAGLQVGVGVLAYGLLWVFGELPFWYVSLFDLFDVETWPAAAVPLGLVVAGLVMTPPAVLMGATFPALVRAAVRDRDHLGGPVGAVYGWNTVGSAIGAFAAGFVLLPSLGIQTTVLVGVALNGVGAALAASRVATGSGRLAALGAWAVAVLGLFTVLRPPWEPLVMTAGLYKYASYFDDHTREGVLRFARHRTDLLFYEEGLSAVVTVARNRKSGNTYLANNGKVDASSSGDMPTQVLVALLPLHLTEKREDVLVIGLASGVTVGAVTRVPGVERVDVVELEPAVVRASRFFDHVNHRVLEDPRVNVIVNDGRNHVLQTPPGTYDVVVSEPPNPWITGVANLFTAEFFRMGKTRLKPGGVWAQWVHLYGMDPFDLQSLLGTFADVYPHVAVYGTIEDADLVLIGSDEPLPVGPEAAYRFWDSAAVVRKELAVVDVNAPLELLCLYQHDRATALEVARDVRRNTDDNMRIEYSAPWHLHEDTSDANAAVLLGALRLPPDLTDPEDLFDVAWACHDRGDSVRGVRALLTARANLPESDPRRAEYLDLARRWRDEEAEDE
jgi:spermidine synthase